MNETRNFLLRHRVGLTAVLFAIVGVAFMWQDHKAHILGFAPYLFLLACPFMHLFMHGGHGGHRHGDDGSGPQRLSGGTSSKETRNEP